MDTQFLTTTPLFRGIREEELTHLLRCLNASERTFSKDEVIFRAGSAIDQVGLVLSGGVNIVVNSYWGNSLIFGHVSPGDIFGENYAAMQGKELLGDVVAAETSQVLLLNFHYMLTSCQENCGYHHRLIYNLLRISAQKSLNLSSRMMHIAPRSLRERLLSYLSEQAMIQGNAHFRIPFDRQQLADYLGVDRSAMSNELSKMRRDGLVEYRKNEFTLQRDAML